MRANVVPTDDTVFAFAAALVGRWDGVVSNGVKNGWNGCSGVTVPGKAFAERQTENGRNRAWGGWWSGPAGNAGRSAGASCQPGHSLWTC